jgi:hypothetical protein
MGRGQCSKMVRKTNRMVERGTKLGGTQHTPVKGRKWSRKDVLEARNLAKQDGAIGSALLVEKTLKSRNKGESKEMSAKRVSEQLKSIKVMKSLGGNTE